MSALFNAKYLFIVWCKYCCFLNEGLIGKSTRLMVLSTLQYLHFCDRVIVMHEGRIQQIGTYDMLKQRQDQDVPLLELICSQQSREKQGRQISKSICFIFHGSRSRIKSLSPAQCISVPARTSSVLRPRSASRTERRNGIILVLRGTKRWNRPFKISIREKMDKKLKKPNFSPAALIGTAGGTFLELILWKLKEKLSKMILIWTNGCGHNNIVMIEHNELILKFTRLWSVPKGSKKLVQQVYTADIRHISHSDKHARTVWY